MGRTGNERTIQELIAEGNDEQTVHLIDALLDQVPARIEERMSKLMQFGRRYMVLALFKEDGTGSEDIEVLLARRFEQRKNSPLASHGQRDQVAFYWYAKAGRVFSAILEQAPSPQAKGAAAMHRGLVYAVCGTYDLARADLDLARSFLPLSPDLSFWRGMIFALQDTPGAALHRACEHDPENERYRQSHPPILVDAMRNGRSTHLSYVL